MNKQNIAIIDDHEIVRLGIKKLLSHYDEYNVVFDIDCPEKIKDHEYKCIDIVILDLSFSNGFCDLSCIDYVKSIIPHVKILIYSMMDEEIYGIDVLKYGVMGFVSKQASGDNLIKGINRIISDNIYLSHKLSNLMITKMIENKKPSLELLSKREKQVLVFLGSGKKITEISEHLFLSSKTISTYKNRIMKKLKLSNLADLIHFCIEKKLVSK